MSIKRQATAELNHDNWDQDEPTDQDMGTFKTASKDVLETRVMRTGKRRFYAPSGDDTKKNVFSGFQGFKKPQPSSFDFLTNLTNGTKKTSNGSLLTSTDSSFTSSSPFGLKSSTPNSGLFQISTIPVTCDASTKPANIFGPAIKSSVFQAPSNTASNLGSIFNSPKSDSEQSPFKIPSTGSTTTANNFFTPTKTDASPVLNTAIIQNTSPIFATTSTNQSTIPTLTSSNSKSTVNYSGSGPLKKTENTAIDVTLSDNQTKDTNVVRFYSKLACLNKAVTEWVKKHVEDTPLCILTPIFRDYEKYLKELQSKYGMENIENELESELQTKTTEPETKASSTFEWPTKPLTSNLFSNYKTKNAGNHSLFDTKTDASLLKGTIISSDADKSADVSKSTSSNLSTFSFSTSSSVVNTTPTFSFGVNNSVLNTSTTNDTTVTFTQFTKASTIAVSTPTTTTFSFNVNNPITTTVSATPSTFSFGTKSCATDSTPSITFGIPSSMKTNDTNTVFPMANKPSTAINMSAPIFSFEIPTSSTITTTSSSTFAFNAKSMTSINSPTSYSVGSTTNTTTSMPSTFLFNPKTTGTTAVSPFGVNMTSSSLNTTNTSTFSFAVKSPSQDQSTTAAAAFSFNMNTPVNTMAGSKPFSFGMGKPFTFNTEKKTESSQQAEKEEDDEPPKVEFTPVVEENSAYDKRCKVYVKKDKEFIDKGVGILYIKKVDDSGKYQLLVRANTNLGNILINLILSKSIPIQRMGKNDVMMGCIPTPDAKPPPIPVLIRVKTSEEADELLETLNKYT